MAQKMRTSYKHYGVARAAALCREEPRYTLQTSGVYGRCADEVPSREPDGMMKTMKVEEACTSEDCYTAGGAEENRPRE